MFDPSLQTKFKPRPELMDVTHPLVAFARSSVAEGSFKAEPVSAIAVPVSSTEAPAGVYVFVIDFWRFDGLRRDIRLQSLVLSVFERYQLEANVADKLIDVAARQGARADLAEFSGRSRTTLTDAFKNCESELEDRFITGRRDFQRDNARRVEQARLLVADRSEAKLVQLREMLDQQRRSDDERRRRASQLTEGRIKKLIADRDQRLARIQATEKTSITRRAVAGGVIIVE